MIKIILKYNKIKTLIKTTKRTNNLTTKVTSYFSFNFFLNIDLLYNDIATELIQADTQKVAYLISIDIYTQEIKKFIKKIFTFFQLNINNPLEVNLLAKEFSVLVTKENKYNYHYIIVSFILEELYNDRLNQNVFLSESIHSCDEIIEAKIKNEKSMLVLYDVLSGRLQIMQGSHDIISFKNKNFESIFPNYLSQEGNKKNIEYFK